MPGSAGWHAWLWLFWAATLLAAIRLVVRWVKLRPRKPVGLPEEILRLRFVHGEIHRAEYKRRLAQLRELKARFTVTGKLPVDDNFRVSTTQRRTLR